MSRRKIEFKSSFHGFDSTSNACESIVQLLLALRSLLSISSGTGVSGDTALSIEPNTINAMKPMPSVLNARLNVFEDELTEQGMQK